MEERFHFPAIFNKPTSSVETRVDRVPGYPPLKLTDIAHEKSTMLTRKDGDFHGRCQWSETGDDLRHLAAPPSRYWWVASRWVLAECLPWPTGCLGLVRGVGWVHYWPFFAVLSLKIHGRLACALVRLCGPWWNHGAALGVASPNSRTCAGELPMTLAEVVRR